MNSTTERYLTYSIGVPISATNNTRARVMSVTMSQSIPPEDISSATQTQIETWKESREVLEEKGEAATTGTNPPLIVADETIASHEYDEVKGEKKRRGEIEKTEDVKRVAKTNRQVKDSLPSVGIGSNSELWEMIAKDGRGAYTGVHPVLSTDGLYIYGCPHMLIFRDEKPVRVIRLRGTSYYDREKPYSNHLIGPWITCRILERSKFDVSEIEFTHIRYRKPEPGERTDRKSKILRQIKMAYADVGDFSNVDPESAVSDLEDVTVDTYEYRSPFEYESVRFEKRLRRSIKLVKGEVEPRRSA